MKNRSRVVVVGGGITGLAAAYNLAKLGMNDVVVVERGYIGGGATGRCAEGIRSQFNLEPNIILAREGQKLYENLSRELNHNILFYQGGYLFLAYNEEEWNLCKENVANENKLGVRSRLITSDEAKEIVPVLNVDGVVGGTFHRKDGAAHHDAVVAAYAKNARRFGVEIQEFTELQNIHVADRRVQKVVTSRGEIETETIINAAGAHSRDIAKLVGVNLPIKPERHELLVTESIKPCLNPMVISFHTGLICRQTMRGEVLGGIGFPDEPDSYNQKSSLRFLETFAREVVKMFPAFRDLRVMRQWAGLYDMSPDGSPIIGETDRLLGFLQASGFSGHGYMIAPMVGKLLAELIVYGKTSMDLEPFNLRRFAQGKLLVERTVVG